VNPRRLSQAISEGDGISVIVHVDGPEVARDAQDAGADAVVVPDASQARSVRGATDLPIVAPFSAGSIDGADAWIVDVRDDDRGELERVHQALEDRLEVAVRIEREEHLEFVLEEFDPEILVLGAPRDAGSGPLDWVLELLPDVPAGKLAIADVGASSRGELEELERAGFDGAIVSGDVAQLVGSEPPDV
jgi:hypothetical protein